MTTPETEAKAGGTTPGKGKKNIKLFLIPISGLIVGAILGSAAVLHFSPGPLATNEAVRAAYDVNIIDNPNFVGKDMLKVNEEKLAELCVRPTVKDVEKKVPLDCKVL